MKLNKWWSALWAALAARRLRTFVLRAAPLIALLSLILLLMLWRVMSFLQSITTFDPTILSGSSPRVVQNLFQVEAEAARSGWNIDLLLRAGSLWEDAGDLTGALPFWEAAALQGDSRVFRPLAAAYIELQRWAEAVDQLTLLVEVFPGDAWAHYQLGLIRAAFDPRAAEAHLQSAAQTPDYQTIAAELLSAVDTNQPDPFGVGLALFNHELWPYAELAFQHAADLGDSYPEALAYAGLARDFQGKDGGALIDQAVALAARSAVVRYVEGLHLRAIGDYAGSLAAFVQAVALDPDNPGYYAALGAAYERVGDLENAERWLRVAVETSGGDPRFQELLNGLQAGQMPSVTPTAEASE